MRRPPFLVLASVTLALLAGGGPAAADAGDPTSRTRDPLPAVIDLPDGFHPEGIAAGRGQTLYVGSLVDGDIWRADARTGEGRRFVDVGGRVAVGLTVDDRTRTLVVAGGPTGQAYLYDARTGDERAVVDLGGGFVNDVAVTRDAYWFTDSFAPVVHRVPIDRAGRPGTPETVPLGDGFEFVAGGFNGNGIVADRTGRTLVLVNSTTGVLTRIDTRTREVTAVDTGAVRFRNGDGLALQGDRLHVVRNADETVDVVALDHRFTRGRVVGAITDEAFRFPTTAALIGRSLYAVNARFDEVPPPLFGAPVQPEEDFEVVRVPTPRGDR